MRFSPKVDPVRCFLGLPYDEGRPLLRWVAARRFRSISGRLVRREGDYFYDSSRTGVENVADRFAGTAFRKFLLDRPFDGPIGSVRYLWACLATSVGLADRKIEDTWHERASADHYYLFEKEW